MSVSVSYTHPSLVIGNVANNDVLNLLKKMDSNQLKIDAAQDKLNSFIELKRSLSLTINELIGLDVPVDSLQDKQTEITTSIAQAASDYVAIKLENEETIQQLKEQLADLEIQDNMETPIDLGKSVLKSLPFSSNSLKLDSQYFSFGSNLQDDTLANIEKFVRSGTGNLGNKSDEVVNAVSSQLQSQFQNHQLTGTLIVTASCTHSNISAFEPLVIDPDKAITSWNTLFGSSDKIDTKLLSTGNTESPDTNGSDDSVLTLITGATYGSSFVGMIHIVNADEKSSEDLSSLAERLDEKMKIGGWLVDAAGGFGVDESVFEDVKAFLSSQSVSSHISLVSLGSTPSISSNAVKLSVSKLSEVDSATINMVIDKANPTKSTISSEAIEAKNEAKIINMQNARVESILKTMGKIDHESNKVIDINSLIQAFENYLTSIKASDKIVGVPISFYLKKITRQDIIDLWTSKYGWN